MKCRLKDRCYVWTMTRNKWYRVLFETSTACAITNDRGEMQLVLKSKLHMIGVKMLIRSLINWLKRV